MTAVPTPERAALARGRRQRTRQRRGAVAALAALVLVLFSVALMVGDTVYTPSEVIRTVLGQRVPGASFTVGELRLPRASTGVLAGAAFGLAGVTFQTMLRNPLAAPDVIGISSGAGAAAVVCVVLLGLDQAATSLVATAGALLTAGVIALLAHRDGIAGTRLILIGIGVSAMLDSVVSSVLLHAASWDVQTAMRWLTGSLNGATWEQSAPLALALLVAAPALASQERSLRLLQLGDDAAAGLGVRVGRTRAVVILAAVLLIAFATAATGPIAFVAFLAGPIAARLVRAGGSPNLPAALVGAALVLAADLIGQSGLGGRYPVGVITGVLGAPYLVLLLIRTNRAGGAL
ncbi:FecCD family ABC transporter permease [Amnibacterium kyonggiense]